MLEGLSPPLPSCFVRISMHPIPLEQKGPSPYPPLKHRSQLRDEAKQEVVTKRNEEEGVVGDAVKSGGEAAEEAAEEVGEKAGDELGCKLKEGAALQKRDDGALVVDPEEGPAGAFNAAEEVG